MPSTHAALVEFVIADAPSVIAAFGEEHQEQFVASIRRHRPTAFGYCLACRNIQWEQCPVVADTAEDAGLDLS